MPKKSTSHPIDKLSFLIGAWITEGEIIGAAAGAGSVAGTDIYTWVAGGNFILHTVQVYMGSQKIESVEVIGSYDKTNDAFTMRSFDNRNAVETLQCHLTKSGSLKISGDGIRSTLTYTRSGKSMKALWERTDDGIHWTPWMRMRFRK